MKYVNKEACLKQRAVDNVLAEVDLLRLLDHAFIVSLWFTFQVCMSFVEVMNNPSERSETNDNFNAKNDRFDL